MMNGMADGSGMMGGAMMWGMGLFWLLVVVLLLLGIAALVKYLFFGNRSGRSIRTSTPASTGDAGEMQRGPGRGTGKEGPSPPADEGTRT